jgi:hypothetical protein
MRSPKHLQILKDMRRREGHGMATLTNRQLPLKTMKRLESLGFVKDAGLVAVCDGDGFTVQPERWRQGWTLTHAGQDLVGASNA